MYFISTVKFSRQQDGAAKAVREQYLFDALSYAECEARTIEALAPFIGGDFAIADIKKPRIAELFNADGAEERWYKVKVAFASLDEGAEKKSSSSILVRAADFGDACAKFEEGMRGALADYEIQSVSETQILDYFPAKLGNSE